MSKQREILYAADIARIRGTSPRAGRAYLAELERKHGSKVVGRDGDKLFITRRNLARFLPGIAASAAEADPHYVQLFRQVQAIAHLVFDSNERINELSERLEAALRVGSTNVVQRLAVVGDGGGGRTRKFAQQRVGGHDRADRHLRDGVPEACPPPSPPAALCLAAPRLPLTEVTEPDTATDLVASDGEDDSPRRSRCETPDEELARLVREQRDDQRQDSAGLRSTVLGDTLRGIGVAPDAFARDLNGQGNEDE
jgi:hypothetical protein